MKYMLMRKADADTEKGLLPSQEILQAMADYNEQMMQAGVFVSGNGIRPSSEGCRVEFRDGEPRIIQGPFQNTEELLAGYSILEVQSLEEAIAWAKQWPREDASGDVTLELRRYFTMDDFEPGRGLEKHKELSRLPLEMNLHVGFPGTCREAMSFYQEVTGGNLEAIITYGETPAADQVPAEWHDRVAHASLNLRGRRLMGADAAGDCYQAPAGAQVHLEYDDPEQAEWVFSQFAKDGTIIMPFEQTFWANRFGMTKDRFGVQWMVSNQTKACL